MRITIPMPSRNRPAGLLSVLTALDALATGQNQITYVLIIDADDEATRQCVKQWFDMELLPPNVHTVIGQRDKILNARMNEIVGTFPADIYCVLPDDGFPLTQGWDAMFAGLSELPAFAWQEKNDPGNATFIAISERWRQATGRMFPEYFPFWFADTWIMEVHLLAFAKPIGVVQQLQMGGKRGQTQGMRDLPFWFDFFAKTRTERIKEAVAVAKEFGFTLDVERDRQDQLKALLEADEYQKQRAPVYAQARGDGADPETDLYREAKARAEAWLEAAK